MARWPARLLASATGSASSRNSRASSRNAPPIEAGTRGTLRLTRSRPLSRVEILTPPRALRAREWTTGSALQRSSPSTHLERESTGITAVDGEPQGRRIRFAKLSRERRTSRQIVSAALSAVSVSSRLISQLTRGLQAELKRPSPFGKDDQAANSQSASSPCRTLLSIPGPLRLQ
jgi:hypothetical protein